MNKAGYRLRLDLALNTLLLLDARLFRLESVRKVVGSLVSEGQVSSLKMVPLSLALEPWVEPLLLEPPDSRELQGEDSVDTGDTAVIVPRRLCLRWVVGRATKSFGSHPAGLPMTVLSL